MLIFLTGKSWINTTVTVRKQIQSDSSLVAQISGLYVASVASMALQSAPSVSFSSANLFTVAQLMSVVVTYYVTQDRSTVTLVGNLNFAFGVSQRIITTAGDPGIGIFSGSTCATANTTLGKLTAFAACYGDFAYIRLLNQCNTSQYSGHFFTGKGNVDFRILPPLGGYATVTTQTLCVGGSVLGLLGDATTTTFIIHLLFTGSVDRVMDYDSRRVTISSNPAVFTVNYATQTITAVGPGTALLLVSYSESFDTTYNISITVRSATSFAIGAHPNPSYSGSTAFTEVLLSPLASTNIWQLTQLQYTLTLSDSTTRDISSASNMQFVSGAGLSCKSTHPEVIQVIGSPVGNSAPTVTIGFWNGVTYLLTATIVITISATPIQLSSISALTFQSANPSGVLAGTATKVQLSGTFSDTTTWAALFTSTPTAILPGLISFTCSNNLPSGFINSVTGPVLSSPSTCDSTLGTVTTLTNSYKLSTLTARSSNGLVMNLTYGTDILPAVYDTDIVPVTAGGGLPLNGAAFTVASTFQVIVNYNAGAALAVTVDAYISFSSTILQATLATATSGGGGVAYSSFFSNLIADPNNVHLGGGVSGSGFTGVKSLSTITFKILQCNRLIALTGYIAAMLTSTSVDLTPANTYFTAGTFWFACGTPAVSRRRRSAPLEGSVADGVGIDVPDRDPLTGQAPMVYQRPIRTAGAVKCLTATPCCVGARATGDVDGDCVFSASDYLFTALYVLSVGVPPLKKNDQSGGDSSAVSANQVGVSTFRYYC